MEGGCMDVISSFFSRTPCRKKSMLGLEWKKPPWLLSGDLPPGAAMLACAPIPTPLLPLPCLVLS